MTSSSILPHATATSADGPACSTSLKNISPKTRSTQEAVMQTHKIQSHTIRTPTECIAARIAQLPQEKEYPRARDRLSEERRALPWVKVDKPYVFDGPDGKQT